MFCGLSFLLEDFLGHSGSRSENRIDNDSAVKRNHAERLMCNSVLALRVEGLILIKRLPLVDDLGSRLCVSLKQL